MGIDEQIKIIDKAICRHIKLVDVSGRGAISQDILKNLRDFVEHIVLKIFAQGSDIDDNWDNIQRNLNTSIDLLLEHAKPAEMINGYNYTLSRDNI